MIFSIQIFSPIKILDPVNEPIIDVSLQGASFFSSMSLLPMLSGQISIINNNVLNQTELEQFKSNLSNNLRVRHLLIKNFLIFLT